MAGIFTIVFSIALECGHTAASRYGDNAAFGVEPQGYGWRIDWQQGPQKPADQAADLAGEPPETLSVWRYRGRYPDYR
jgi:hypothetical protein